MKITNEIDCRCTVRATFSEEAGLTVRVSAAALYDQDTGASTSVDIDVPEAEKKVIEAALARALKACEQQVPAKITDAIATSRKVAQTLKEIK